ncbi:MAG: hypothetical protein Q8T03_07040 [Bacteroidota bacterium]|nr:hypothetical protein [Bacteroidota bacterium]
MVLSFKIKSTAELIFDYLSDMQKFVLVHPVIFKIDDTGNNTYLVHEKLQFGFIPVTFTYPFTIEKNLANKIIIMRATVMKFTKIEIHFSLKQENDFTLVEETIQFKSPLPVKFIMQGIFKKQHTQLFKNIETKN